MKNFRLNDFYLAGGTALALHFGHRKSVDFDFFTEKKIDNGILLNNLVKIFQGQKVVKTMDTIDTLYVEINGIKFSFFSYPYKLISPKISSEYFDIASIEDIGCMKLSSIQSRSTNKDYVDLYYILQRTKLENLLNFYFQKFGEHTTKSGIKGKIVC